MTTFNTGNAVPSADARDRFDNSLTFDQVINGTLTFYPNRIGANVMSLAGMAALFNAAQIARANEYAADKAYRDTTYVADKLARDTEFAEDQVRRETEFDEYQARHELEFSTAQSDRSTQFNLFLGASGYEDPIPYAPGIDLPRVTKTVLYLGNIYRVRAEFMPLVTTDWATDGPKLKLVGDDSLRQDLANAVDPDKGSEIVAFKQDGAEAIPRTVNKKLKDTSVTVEDFGVVSGVDDTAVFAKAIAYAADKGCELHCVSTSVYALNRVQAASGLHLFGNGATIKPTAAYVAGNSTKYGLIEATGLDDVRIRGFKGALRSSTDRVVFVRGDSCTNLYIEEMDYVCNGLDGIQVKGGEHIFIRRNKARINPSGTAPTAAIRVFGAMKNWEISDNDVAGVKVTQPHGTIGVQPPGDLWGGNAIAVTNGGDWPGDSGGQGAWKNITGSYTVPAGAAATYVVTDAQITVPDDWEGAAALTWNTVTGDGDGATDPLKVTFQVGQMTISGISAAWAGLVISYQALYFGTTPRFGKIDRNKVDGMLYAGLTLINARDVVATDNDLRRCSDLGWDPEGCIRTTIVGGQWHDCGTGGALAGGGSHIIDVEIYSNSTAIIFGGNNIAYQGLVQVAMVGLRGGNLIQGVRHFHTDPGNVSNTFINGNAPPGLTIQSNHSNLRLNNAPITNASRLTINGNSFSGRIYVTNSSKVVITDNVSRSPTQGGIRLDGVSNFRVSGNTVHVTTGVYGEASGVRYASCTNGYMDGNHLLSSSGALYNNAGGNTNVIVTKPTLTGSASYAGETLAAGTKGATGTITITGLVLGDFVNTASLNVNLNGCELVTYVSGNNTVSYYLRNNTAGSVTLGAGTVTAMARNA